MGMSSEILLPLQRLDTAARDVLPPGQTAPVNLLQCRRDLLEDALGDQHRA